MSRVEMIHPDDAEGRVEDLFEAVTAMLGRVPNSYRVLAQSPLVAQFMAPSTRCFSVREPGAFSPPS